MGPCSCEDGNVTWVQRYFLDCVYGKVDLLAFLLGLSSILLWMGAQAPQLWTNYKRGSAEALSVWFLLQWLMGDSCNLAGCLLTGSQLPTETYTAVYFICADLVILSQYTYYNYPGHVRCSRSEDDNTDVLEGRDKRKATIALLVAIGCGVTFGLLWLLKPAKYQALDMGIDGAHSSLLHQDLPMCGQSDRPRGLIIIGNWCGWISSVFYLFSRISQIAKNIRRRSVVGLALGMFMTAVAANLAYGVSILLRVHDSEDFLSKFPWLLGSLGTVSLDMTILLQSKIYAHSNEQEVTQPLLT